MATSATFAMGAAAQTALPAKNKARVVSMTTQKLTKADMNPAIGYVRAGVVELMKRQDKGWAYVRP